MEQKKEKQISLEIRPMDQGEFFHAKGNYGDSISDFFNVIDF